MKVTEITVLTISQLTDNTNEALWITVNIAISLVLEVLRFSWHYFGLFSSNRLHYEMCISDYFFILLQIKTCIHKHVQSVEDPEKDKGFIWHW